MRRNDRRNDERGRGTGRHDEAPGHPEPAAESMDRATSQGDEQVPSQGSLDEGPSADDRLVRLLIVLPMPHSTDGPRMSTVARCWGPTD